MNQTDNNIIKPLSTTIAPCPFCGEPGSLHEARKQLLLNMQHKPSCYLYHQQQPTYRLLAIDELKAWNIRANIKINYDTLDNEFWSVIAHAIAGKDIDKDDIRLIVDGCVMEIKKEIKRIENEL